MKTIKTKKVVWGNRNWEFYKPQQSRSRQGILFSLVAGDIILPMTFGAGIIVTKLITKFKPLFMYNKIYATE